VLTQSGTPRAREIVVQIARGKSNSDLQMKALFLGGNGEKLLELARTEKDPALRLAAVHNLGLMGKRWGDPLAALALHAAPEAVDALIDTARRDASAHVLGQALFWLGQSRAPPALTFFEEVLSGRPR
jgi:hypothetical protein